MPSAKKNAVTIDPPRDVERELSQLYARRSAIDALIASLEEYERYRSTRIDSNQRLKTA